jgi:hypothetical protein
MFGNGSAYHAACVVPNSISMSAKLQVGREVEGVSNGVFGQPHILLLLQEPLRARLHMAPSILAMPQYLRQQQTFAAICMAVRFQPLSTHA